MNRSSRLTGSVREIRTWTCLGLIAVVLVLTPWPVHADDQWADGRQFGLLDSADGSPAGAHVVAALSPGSILMAQAGGGAAPEGSGNDWQFTVAPYFWLARTKMNLDVGQFSREGQRCPDLQRGHRDERAVSGPEPLLLSRVWLDSRERDKEAPHRLASQVATSASFSRSSVRTEATGASRRPWR